MHITGHVTKGGVILKETDLFEPVKKLLMGSDMEVYTEVPCGGGRADIVGIKNKLVTVVELKTSLNLQLIQQAYDRLGYANYVYMAFPYSKNGIARIARNLCRRDGIGIIEIRTGNKYTGFEYASICIPARLFRKTNIKWASDIASGYRCENNALAGVNQDFYSPYQDMIHNVKRFLKIRYPSAVSISDILEHVEQVSKHYAQPKNSLYSALTKYEKDWCEVAKIKGKTYFRMKKALQTFS